jgi:hypothetical protein
MNEIQGADWARQVLEALDREGWRDCPEREFGDAFGGYGSYVMAWAIDDEALEKVPGLDEGDVGKWLCLVVDSQGFTAASVESEESLDAAEAEWAEWLVHGAGSDDEDHEDERREYLGDEGEWPGGPGREP